MGDKKKGLYEKFKVERTDGRSAAGCKHYRCKYFVIDLTHDKHGAAAIRAYATSCLKEYPKLADDLFKQAAALDKKFATDEDNS